MVRVRGLAVLLCAAMMLFACGRADVGALMEGFLWQNPVVLVFAPDGNAHLYTRQRGILSQPEVTEGLKARDVRVIYLVDRDSVWIDGQNKPRLFTPPFYDYFDVPRDSFTFVLIGRDGEEKMRSAVTVGEDTLFALIDAMPAQKGPARSGAEAQGEPVRDGAGQEEHEQKGAK